MRITEGLTFGDVLIEPRYSNISSRDEIDITSYYLGAKRLPIISAPMDTVSGPQLVSEMAEANAYGILHRFQENNTKRTNEVFITKDLTSKEFGISIGVKNPDLEIDCFKQFGGHDIHSVLIDVAHGYHNLVGKMIQRINEAAYLNCMDAPYIIAGNVATYDGFVYLAESGANAIRVGIGGGSACTTRGNTGIGVPQLTAIIDCVQAQQNYPDVALIADGGIQQPGDIVKALAVGADAVMLGKMLAGSIDAPGYINGNVKEYKGQSSIGINGKRNAPEGISGTVPLTGPVKETIDSLSQYIKSGMSYTGSRNLKELRERAKFIKDSNRCRKWS